MANTVLEAFVKLFAGATPEKRRALIFKLSETFGSGGAKPPELLTPQLKIALPAKTSKRPSQHCSHRSQTAVLPLPFPPVTRFTISAYQSFSEAEFL